MRKVQCYLCWVEHAVSWTRFAAKEFKHSTALQLITVAMWQRLLPLYSLKFNQDVLSGKQIQLLFNLHKRCPVGRSIASWDQLTTTPET